MNVRHGKLEDVIGRPAKFQGVTIVPAIVRLAGNRFRPCHRLAELPRHMIPPVLRSPVDKMYDAAWVRARLPRAFGISPLPSETEKTLVEAGFVAIADGTDEALAFECVDHYGRTALTFSEAETDEAQKARVAEAFWGIMLSDPEELTDFESVVLHSGAGVWIHFGCKDAEPFCYETREGPGEE